MLELKNITRYVAARQLFIDVNLQIQGSGIRAIIGRNGEGKSTLLRIISALDNDYEGDRLLTRGETIAFATQESNAEKDETTRQYIKRRLPEYEKLNLIIENGDNLLAGSNSDMHRYSDAIERFTERGYFSIDADIDRLADTVELDMSLLEQPYSNLSGGQQKLADLIMIMASPATIYLFDEPTNHMDLEAKSRFIDWMKRQKHSIIVVTHDRDVLDSVDVIYELKDRQLHEYPGNYTAYLRQNRVATSSSIHQYEVNVRSLDNLKKQLVEAERKKLRCKSTPNPFVPLVERLKREVIKVEEQLERPSAWIDQESIADLKPDEKKRYEKYKTASLGLRSHHQSSRGAGSTLVACDNLSVGYEVPLFRPTSFQLTRGGRLRISGRNGIGKTTLIGAIIDTAFEQPLRVKPFSGTITTAPKLTIAEYKQHGDEEFYGMKLAEAVSYIYEQAGRPVNETTIRRALAQFLFDPIAAYDTNVTVLSGGEKARLNLMKLLLLAPDVMVLDEPTNHLDLPSIEELEAFLKEYDGAVMYVSHDGYFARSLGGETKELLSV